MSVLNLERVREVWRDLPDVEVVRGLRRGEDFPPEVLAIIRAEAERRMLDLEALGPEALANPEVVTRVAAAVRVVAVMFGRKVPRLCRRWPMVGGVCVGVGTFLLGQLLSNWDNPGHVLHLILLVGAYMTGLGAVCWPLRRYRVALAAGVGAMLGALAFGLLYFLVGFWAIPEEVPFWALLFPSWLLVGGVIPVALLLGAVWVRNRYWPIYPAERCERCGYDLRGLTEPRCPECWTTFVREEGDSDSGDHSVAAS